MPDEKYNVVLERSRNTQTAIKQSHFTRIRRNYWLSYEKRDHIGSWFYHFEEKYGGKRKGFYIRSILARKMPRDHGFTQKECERIAQLIEKENDLYSQKDKALIAKFDALQIKKKFYRSSEQIEKDKTKRHEERLEKFRKIKENREALEIEPLPDEDNSLEEGSLHDVITEDEELKWLEQEIENEKS